MRGPALVVGLGLVLTGCGIPPAVTVAGYVADGVLLAGTGRTSTDHGLSLATGRDCAVWRMLDGREICTHAPGTMQAADALEVPALDGDRPAELIGEEHHEEVLDGRG